MDKIDCRKDHRKEQKEQITTDFKFHNEITEKEEKEKQWRIAVVCTISKICAGENTSRDKSEEPQEPQQSKMAEVEDDIKTAHEVCKHLALRYVYELNNFH